MKLKVIIVDLELSPRAKRALIHIGVPVAFLLGGGALAYAGGWTLPHQWGTGAPDGTTLSATALDENFSALANAGAALDTRVTALEGLRTETAIITGACVAGSQSGAWMTVAPTPGVALGDCSVTFTAGTFSSPPTCVATSYGVNGAFPRYMYSVRASGQPGTTGVRFLHGVVDGAYSGTVASPNTQAVNEAFGITCVGPK